MKKIIIIGGGAAGMTAAITAAQENPQIQVHILEHKDTVGKKILSTGNGRCNFTNAIMNEQCFFSDTPGIIKNVLDYFGTKDTLAFFETLGILAKERNGYYYPRSDQASAVLSVLKMQLKQLGIRIDTGVHVTSVKRTKAGFRIAADGKTYEADKVILATGGKAASVLGSDGSGYTIAKSFDHSMVPVVPALVQLKVKNHVLAKASGVRTDAKVSIYDAGKFLTEDTGEVQITAYGISGIPVFQISRHAAKALYYKRKAEVKIDFLPKMDFEELLQFFKTRKKGRGYMTAAEFLVGIFNQKLIPCLLKCAGIRERITVSEMKADLWERLARVCKSLTLEIADTNGFENAQVCAGGICLAEVDADTMESLCCKGLYLAGEILDVDGICGGYNLQWAWASGTIAGKSAAR